jgi:hypothetical protein
MDIRGLHRAKRIVVEVFLMDGRAPNTFTTISFTSTFSHLGLYDPYCSPRNRHPPLDRQPRSPLAEVHSVHDRRKHGKW